MAAEPAPAIFASVVFLGCSIVSVLWCACCKRCGDVVGSWSVLRLGLIAGRSDENPAEFVGLNALL